MNRFIRAVTVQKFIGEASTIASDCSISFRIQPKSSAIGHAPRSGPGCCVQVRQLVQKSMCLSSR